MQTYTPSKDELQALKNGNDQPFKQALAASGAVKIDCSCMSIDDTTATYLARAIQGSNVTTLYLWDNNIGDEDAKAIAEALKGSMVTTLNLKNNNRR